MLAQWTKVATLAGVSVVTKADEAEAWKRCLLESVDGRGLRPAGRTPSAGRWVTDPSFKITGKDFIKAIHVRLACLKTPVRAARGSERQPVNLMCRFCRMPNSLGHMLQVCPVNHGLRIERHENIVQSLRRTFLRKGKRVEVEPRVPSGRSFLKPDLVVFDQKSAYVLDPSIVADGFDLEEALRTKRQKYGTEEVEDHCKNLVAGIDGRLETFLAEGIILSWR